MLQRLGGRVLFRSAPNFHAKCILADPEDALAGMLLTANLTREAPERNNELAVELSDHEVRQAAELMRWAMWEAADQRSPRWVPVPSPKSDESVRRKPVRYGGIRSALPPWRSR